jgi:hypothetical protein
MSVSGKLAARRDTVATIFFDSDTVIKRLKATGFTEEQAEVIVDASRDALSQLVTKDDLDQRLTALDCTGAAHEHQVWCADHGGGRYPDRRTARTALTPLGQTRKISERYAAYYLGTSAHRGIFQLK